MSPARAPVIKAPCVIGKYCHEHEFVHGAEAEELRVRLELFIKHARSDIRDDYELEDVTGLLQELLGEVDARDSLAFVEVKPRKWKPQNERAVRVRSTKPKKKAPRK